MQDKNFPISLELRIDWSELDYFGHVNNVMFIKYIQAARVRYWEEIGLINSYEKEKTGPILISTRCDFKKRLHYPGNIIVQTRMDYIRNTSFALEHVILNGDGEIAAEAQDVCVVFDYNLDKKISFPDDLRNIVEKLEGRKF